MRLNLRVHFKIELPFKLHMLTYLLVYKSAKNSSMKGELKGSLYVALEGAPKISFREDLKLYKHMEKKINLTLLLMVHLSVQLGVYLKVHLRMQLFMFNLSNVWLYAFSLQLYCQRDFCTQFFSCEFCRNFKNNFLLEHSWMCASDLYPAYLNQTST